MSVTRRAQVVLVALLAVVVAGGWSWAAHAQTTTEPTTTSTRLETSTTRAATTTSARPSSTTTTTRRTTRLTFTATPAIGAPGTNIAVASTAPCTATGNLYVLLSIGQFRLGSGAPDSAGNWRFNVVVPQVNPGTYGLAATCLVSRNGVDENAGIYVGPDFVVTQGSGPAPPTTPEAHKSDNTALIIGLVVAVVIAIAAIAYALWLRSKHRKELAAATGGGPGGPPTAGSPGGPGSAPPDTFA